MSKYTLRIVFTILMYAGVAVVLIPYATGRMYTGLVFLIVGMGIAVGCGMLRCYFTEGDSPEQHISSKPCP
jgi:hypothetical protein